MSGQHRMRAEQKRSIGRDKVHDYVQTPCSIETTFTRGRKMQQSHIHPEIHFKEKLYGMLSQAHTDNPGAVGNVLKYLVSAA